MCGQYLLHGRHRHPHLTARAIVQNHLGLQILSTLYRRAQRLDELPVFADQTVMLVRMT